MAGNSFLHVTDLNYQKCIFFFLASVTEIPMVRMQI